MGERCLSSSVPPAAAPLTTMQRKQGDLIPVGEALADLGGPVEAIRDASPQAHYHFTQADQVNQLVSASEADPDLGFMARMMALTSWFT